MFSNTQSNGIILYRIYFHPFWGETYTNHIFHLHTAEKKKLCTTYMYFEYFKGYICNGSLNSEDLGHCH